MTIPNFQDLMLPLLQLTSDGQIYTLSVATDILADHFQLSVAEREEMLLGGLQSTFFNRVTWASIHLTKANLLERISKGKFRITSRGIDVVKANPQHIDLKYLRKIQASQQGGSQENGDDLVIDVTPVQTPEESLETAYQSLRRDLSQNILSLVKQCSPKFFERLVVDVLLAMGYGGSRKDAGQAIGQSGDDGVDGVIKEDKLGLDVVYVQAKRWENTVGRPQIQGFAGSLEGLRARKGVFITTSQFSQEAKEYVNRIEKKIVLIDGEQLAQFMIDYGVGVSEVASYTVKKVDLDYFDED